jgi:beta-1,2-mannobiose phosphorylase / 1,2-beta-oligomannan phosphorylase
MFSAKRSTHNPILSPQSENAWESVAAFNLCPAHLDEKVHAVYRAQGTSENTNVAMSTFSMIGHAVSDDGIHFNDRRPFIHPEFDWERFGCEDPRVTLFEGKYYIFYTALSVFPFTASGIKSAVAITKDFKTVEEKHPVTPFNSKAMALFPERIGGKIWVVLSANTDMPPARVAFASFDSIEDLWNQTKWKEWYKDLETHAFDVRRSPNDQVEVGAPPIKTKKGWLLIYSHIQNYFSDKKVFGIEALLLDLKNPEIIIGRTKGPFIVPEESYERFGQVSNITFPSGGYVENDKLIIYYGAADTSVGRAEINLDTFLDSIIPENAAKQVVRFEGNPTILPNPKNEWESFAVFNPAAIELEGKTYILYRAMSKDNTSTVGLAISSDGLRVDEKLDKPIYVPRGPFEGKGVPNGNSGCEDPRIVRIDDRLYMTYTAYNGIEVPRVAVSSISVEDFLARRWNWSEPIIITPPEVDDKDSCIIPGKFGNKYMVIHRINGNICADYVDSLDFTKERVTKAIELLRPRPGMWDGAKIGIASPPLRTEKGWLLFYHGVSDTKTYRLGAALLDLENPQIVISRISDALLQPEMTYEKFGVIPNVVFPCGIIERNNMVYIYYGGADTVVAVATMKLSSLIDALTK